MHLEYRWRAAHHIRRHTSSFEMKETERWCRYSEVYRLVGLGKLMLSISSIKQVLSAVSEKRGWTQQLGRVDKVEMEMEGERWPGKVARPADIRRACLRLVATECHQLILPGPCSSACTAGKEEIESSSSRVEESLPGVLIHAQQSKRAEDNTFWARWWNPSWRGKGVKEGVDKD